jgi:hypothetical protein
MQFGFFYVHGQFTLYDVTLEIVGGHRLYVASLSADPSVRCLAARGDFAVAALRAHLEQAAMAPAPPWSRQPMPTAYARA